MNAGHARQKLGF